MSEQRKVIEPESIQLLRDVAEGRREFDAEIRNLVLPNALDEFNRYARAVAAVVPREALFCVHCGKQHIDGANGELFAFRPHHTHLCQFCGKMWDVVRWSFGADVKPTSALLMTCARIAHEFNTIYCKHIGEAFIEWGEMSDPMRDGVLGGARLALEGKTPQELHTAWCESRRAEGWTYGETKDYEKRTHPCLVPYTELPPVQRAKDEFFSTIVRCVALVLRGPYARTADEVIGAVREAMTQRLPGARIEVWLFLNSADDGDQKFIAHFAMYQGETVLMKGSGYGNHEYAAAKNLADALGVVLS